MLSIEEIYNDGLPVKIGEDNLGEYSTIYHYTSMNGFKGIIDNRRFWISDFKYLNDSTEMFHTLVLLKKVIERRPKHISSNELVHEFESTINEGINFFVLSFSTSSDNLSLWYNYADNEGVAIGFDLNLIKNMINSPYFGILTPGNKTEISGVALYDTVVYEDVQKENILNQLLDYYEKLYDGYDNSFRKPIRTLTTHKLLTCALFFKNQSFFPEQEYRIVLNIHNNIENALLYRINNGLIIPYCEIGITIFSNELLPIKELIIGPRNKKDIAKTGFKRYLNSKGYMTLNLKNSEIPLRY